MKKYPDPTLFVGSTLKNVIDLMEKMFLFSFFFRLVLKTLSANISWEISADI
jgi:hypothetical protein